jgi:hypothetical protein
MYLKALYRSLITREEPSDLFYTLIPTAISTNTDATVTVFSITPVHHYAVRVIIMSWFSLDVMVCKRRDCEVGCSQETLNTSSKPHLFPTLTRTRTRTGPAYTQEIINKCLKLNPRDLPSALADLATRVQRLQSQHPKEPQCFSVNSAGRDIRLRSLLSFRPSLSPRSLPPCCFPCLSLLLITI